MRGYLKLNVYLNEQHHLHAMLRLTPRKHNNETRADAENTDPCNRRKEKLVELKLSPFYAAVLSIGKSGFDRP